jgi:hypothetical protein
LPRAFFQKGAQALGLPATTGLKIYGQLGFVQFKTATSM